MTDNSTFPHPVYKDTVLAPLFEGAKTHHVDAFRMINQAHLVMLVEEGILPTKTGHELAKALRSIDEEVDVSALTYTGEVEDYFFLVEAELKKRLGPDVAGALHTARSRNDMDHTVFKLGLQKRVDHLIQSLHNLVTAMHETAAREKETLIVAYTHGQPAQPSTFGHYLLAASEVLLRDLDRLMLARDQIEKCPMGAAAITTSGFPVSRQHVAELLGFEEPLENSYGCIASVDYITGLYSAIKLVFVHLGRVIQDFQFWSAFEVGQLYVPNALVQISSIMPQKRNPVPIEHMRHLCSVTAGRCDMMVNTMHNTPFTDMNDSEGEVQQAGYATFESGGRAIDLLAAFIPALSINDDRVAKTADAACITITELADTLVREESISFRQAHEVAAATAKKVIAEGKSLGDAHADFMTAFIEMTGRESHLDEAAYRRSVSARHFVNVRKRFGGPAPVAIEASLERQITHFGHLKAHFEQIQTRKKTANQMREKAFDALLNNRGE
ncbi:argininosuccinate lyase [Maritalea myrionectae]|uniref:Argininosuccinate lyase n=1 Tax=Maritalea myrionectae TaxID=454601 RepID=A0A2R4MIA6_9HYPH|nr:argininosuccinate lyase [Maritalea myrionectae]AVX05755.1 argininosuccinate lyase [Maritalea myrionectae]